MEHLCHLNLHSIFRISSHSKTLSYILGRVPATRNSELVEHTSLDSDMIADLQSYNANLESFVLSALNCSETRD